MEDRNPEWHLVRMLQNKQESYIVLEMQLDGKGINLNTTKMKGFHLAWTYKYLDLVMCL